jgi:dTDP-4-amino-4,6-dideoxygalactose transaminase
VARHGSKEVVIETYDEVGYNYRMTDLQAAVGLVQLGRMNEFLERRRYLAARYTEKLSEFPWVIPPFRPAFAIPNFQSYMVRLSPNAPVRRDALMQSMLERGISTRRGIMASHRELPYRGTNWEKRLPETNDAADECFILPLFHQMTEEEQDFVIDAVREIAGGVALKSVHIDSLFAK